MLVKTQHRWSFAPRGQSFGDLSPVFPTILGSRGAFASRVRITHTQKHYLRYRLYSCAKVPGVSVVVKTDLSCQCGIQTTTLGADRPCPQSDEGTPPKTRAVIRVVPVWSAVGSALYLCDPRLMFEGPVWSCLPMGYALVLNKPVLPISGELRETITG